MSLQYQNNIFYFTERERYNTSEYKFLTEMQKVFNGILEEENNVFRFLVTGFLIYEDYLIIIFPKGYHISTTLKHESLTLLNVLLRYRESSSLAPEEISMLRGNNINRNGRLVSSLTLIDDYQINGFLKRSVIKNKYKANGFIDWSRTVKTTFPIVINREPFYLHPVTRSKINNPDNIISKIHKAVIGESLEFFGWLCGFDSSQDNNFKMPCDANEAVLHLKAELRRTYVQREVRVLTLLVNYLSSKTGDDDSHKIEILATPNFNNTWEAICGNLFENQYQYLSKIVPKPEWKNKLQPCLKLGKPRPDILYIYDNVLYILDAKFYDYHVSAPGWHDILKQFYYYFTISKNIQRNIKINHLFANVKKIENVFILPENSEKEISCLGNVFVDNVNEFGELSVFTINSRQALELYASRSVGNHRELIKKHIEEYNK